MSSIKLQRGFTLVELIVAIVIIGICSVSFMALLASQASRSGEAMIRDQATHIASAYLDEVLQKPFNDPGVVTGRNGYHYIADYNGLVDNGARDQFDNAIAGLSQFNVTVTVVASYPGAGPPNQSWLATVTVQHANGTKVVLSGYRMKYP
jgi:MSHA pilin protein MshD